MLLSARGRIEGSGLPLLDQATLLHPRFSVAHYQLCDFILRSNVALPQLQPTKAAGPRHSFRLHLGARPQPSPNCWFHEWRTPDGQVWLSFAHQGSGYLLRFPGMADFWVSADGAEIDGYAGVGVDLETIRHLLLDQVIPLVLAHQGEQVLHASAIASPQGAIAFLGETGRGKTTLSASFCQEGFPLLTDDLLLLRPEGERYLAYPSYPGLRLWPQTRSAFRWDAAEVTPVAHYTSKERVRLTGDRFPLCTVPVPVAGLYVLAPPGEATTARAVQIHPLTPQEAFLEVVRCSFRLDVADRDSNRRAFEQTSEAVSALKLYRLSFPRDLSLLPAVRAAILEHLGQGCQTAGTVT